MTLAAGRKDRLIGFERNTPTTDGYGGEVDAWGDLGSAWARVIFGTGEERRQAAREEGGQSASFVVSDCAMTRGVTIADRISFGSSPWDIKGISPLDGGEIEFTARRAL